MDSYSGLPVPVVAAFAQARQELLGDDLDRDRLEQEKPWSRSIYKNADCIPGSWRPNSYTDHWQHAITVTVQIPAAPIRPGRSHVPVTGTGRAGSRFHRAELACATGAGSGSEGKITSCPSIRVRR